MILYFLGTPPRLKKSTINFENLQKHKGDNPPVAFSFLNNTVWLERENIPQLDCHMTFTNEKTREIIMDNMHQNRHVTGYFLSNAMIVRKYDFQVIESLMLICKGSLISKDPFGFPEYPQFSSCLALKIILAFYI